MADRLPSLDLLLELVQAVRDKQLTHFDAVNNKGGIVLGFSGLLITLASGSRHRFPVSSVS